MDDDPFSGYGLQPVKLTDQALLGSFFKSLSQPLSDYTFSQLYTRRNSLRILWTRLEGHLCVFANGSGDLTMLAPPIAPPAGDAGPPAKALAAAWDIMCAYNADHGVPHRTRIEYASDELLARFDRARLNVQPMGTDYVYDVHRMIDLAGGDLASKRQAKNRFLRNYPCRIEEYDNARHQADCQRLLASWKQRQDAAHETEGGTNALKRQKESLACDLTLECAGELGLRGMVVYVRETQDSDWSLRGFTFGEVLNAEQSSIIIEKTDLAVKGLAQFIFSEFCARYWADRPLVNVGDDWGLQSLAWTKMSYRPVRLLQKYSFTVASPPQLVAWPGNIDLPAAAAAEPAIASDGLAGPMLAGPKWRRRPAATEPGRLCHFDAHAQAASDLGDGPAPAFAADALEAIDMARKSTKTSAAQEGVVHPALVRMARKDDLAAAVELEQSSFDAHCITKRQFQYLQQRPSAVFVVAEDEGKLIGQGIALVRRHHKGVSGRIYSLAVSKAARGKKVGRKLMDRLIDELVGRGVRHIHLQVEASNAPAIALYQQLGFRSVGVLPDYYGRGRAGLRMTRQAEEAAMLFDKAQA